MEEVNGGMDSTTRCAVRAQHSGPKDETENRGAG